MSANLVIGIDPGVNTGFAVYDRAVKELTALKKITFWEAYEYFSIHAKGNENQIYRVVVEVPNTKKVWGDPKRKYNVGRNNRESGLLADGIARLGFAVTRQHPLGKLKPIKNGMTAHERFCRITGWTGSTNEHTRDAGMLCFGF
jgi:hypothetical protein